MSNRDGDGAKQQDRVTRRVYYLRMAMLGVGFVVSLAVLVHITSNRIGPRWFWSGDACPDPTVTCGIVPMGVIFASLIGVLFSLAGLWLTERFLNPKRVP